MTAARAPRSGPGAAIHGILRQAAADAAEAATWLPGRYAWEKDLAVRVLTGLSEDLARAAVIARSFPGYPPEWPGYSYSAAVALAAASTSEPDLAAWLAAMVGTIPRGAGQQLAAVLAEAAGGTCRVTTSLRVDRRRTRSG